MYAAKEYSSSRHTCISNVIDKKRRHSLTYINIFSNTFNHDTSMREKHAVSLFMKTCDFLR